MCGLHAQSSKELQYLSLLYSFGIDAIRHIENQKVDKKRRKVVWRRCCPFLCGLVMCADPGTHSATPC